MEAAGVLTMLGLVAYAPFAALGAARLWTAEDTRAVVREDCRAWVERARAAFDDTDDAPWWAEVLAVVVPFGLLFRAASHVVAAHAHDLDPELADRDVAAGNAVAPIRAGGHRQADLNGRIVAFLTGLVLWWIYLPGAGPQVAIQTGHVLSGVARAYLLLNVTVLFADLVLFAAVLHRSTTNDTDARSTHATR